MATGKMRTDRLGARVGTRAAKINAVLSSEAKTMAEITAEAGVKAVPQHLYTMRKRGLVMKTDERPARYKLTDSNSPDGPGRAAVERPGILPPPRPQAPQTIRIDQDVYSALSKLAVPFVETPNDVLRRVLGLGKA